MDFDEHLDFGKHLDYCFFKVKKDLKFVGNVLELWHLENRFFYSNSTPILSCNYSNCNGIYLFNRFGEGCLIHVENFVENDINEAKLKFSQKDNLFAVLVGGKDIKQIYRFCSFNNIEVIGSIETLEKRDILVFPKTDEIKVYFESYEIVFNHKSKDFNKVIEESFSVSRYFTKKTFNGFKKELNYNEMLEYVNQLNESTNNIHDDGTLISVNNVKSSIGKNGNFILCYIDINCLPYFKDDNGRVSKVTNFFQDFNKVSPIIVNCVRSSKEKLILFDGHTRSKVAKDLGFKKVVGYVPESLVDKYSFFTKI